MEHHAQSVDDALIGGLSYKLKPGTSYVTNRRSVSYFAQGGNHYSPNGVKVMKFNWRPMARPINFSYHVPIEQHWEYWCC